MNFKNISIKQWFWLPFGLTLSIIIDLLAYPYLKLQDDKTFQLTKDGLRDVRDVLKEKPEPTSLSQRPRNKYKTK